MTEVICPKCGRENVYKKGKYESRPMRTLRSPGGETYLSCIMCGWERRLSFIGKWWFRRYEKNYRERYN
jgi:RNase P subunit RPR2